MKKRESPEEATSIYESILYIIEVIMCGGIVLYLMKGFGG
jgi:hypothetical protein